MLSAMDLDALVEAYRQGQPAARRQLPSALYRMILPIFRRRLEKVDVEDLARDTIVIILQELDKFEPRGPGSFRAWVFKIAKNRRRTRSRRQNLEHRTFGQLDEEGAAAQRSQKPDHQAHWRERVALLRDALLGLDPIYRKALVHLCEGGELEELAEREGVKPQTIHTRINRGRKQAAEEIRARRKTTGRLIESFS